MSLFGLAGGGASVGALTRSAALELKRAALRETEELEGAYPQYVMARALERRGGMAALLGFGVLLGLFAWRFCG